MKATYLQYPLESGQQAEAMPAALAIGDFDGVHLGHREVLLHAVQTAERLGVTPAVMTFHPHPREVLGRGQYANWLTPLAIKLELMRELGLKQAYVVSFNHELAALPPAQFVEQMLIPLQVAAVSIGFNFTFGHRGAGTPEDLLQFSGGRYEVGIASPFELDGDRVSSTRIRESLSAGDPGTASRLLGRPYAFTGEVVHGEGRGRTIGFPTANIQLDDCYFLPRQGVYAVLVHHAGAVYRGVMNIGVKPTFHQTEEQKSIEIHLFDFRGDLYGSRLKVEPMLYIREEQRFPSVQELIRRIHQDAEEAKVYLSKLL